jgi:6-pyruvoyltetrahydropterin/6-carboxytetrahydropterin synthase
MYRLEVRHNLEAAHRFYQADCSPKCRSIHGHSWVVVLTLLTPKLDAQGMVIEFGQLKTAWRGWLDAHLDHSLWLHQEDPLVAVLHSASPELRLFLLPHDPTTEHLAQCLAEQAKQILAELGCSPLVQVAGLRLEETRVNAAEYLLE